MHLRTPEAHPISFTLAPGVHEACTGTGTRSPLRITESFMPSLFRKPSSRNMPRRSAATTFALLMLGGGEAHADYVANKYTDPASGQVLEYNVFVPAGYDPVLKYPLMVVMHAAGTAADLPRTLASDGKGWAATFIASPHQAKDPSFFLIPISQTNASGWGDPIAPINGTQKFEGRLTVTVLKDLLTRYSIDRTRLYITGPSMGGRGTWDVIRRNPGLFAAAAPMAAPALAADAPLYVGENIWAANGQNDSTVQANRDAIAAIRRLGGNPIYTEFANRGHDTWRTVYPDAQFLEWVYAQRLGTPWTVSSKAPTFAGLAGPAVTPPNGGGGASGGTTASGGADGAGGGRTGAGGGPARSGGAGGPVAPGGNTGETGGRAGSSGDRGGAASASGGAGGGGQGALTGSGGVVASGGATASGGGPGTGGGGVAAGSGGTGDPSASGGNTGAGSGGMSGRPATGLGEGDGGGAGCSHSGTQPGGNPWWAALAVGLLVVPGKRRLLAQLRIEASRGEKRYVAFGSQSLGGVNEQGAPATTAMFGTPSVHQWGRRIRRSGSRPKGPASGRRTARGIQ